MYSVYIVYILTRGTIVSNLGKQCLSLIALKYYLSTFNWLKKCLTKTQYRLNLITLIPEAFCIE